ncbi:hypothetical protein [Bacillus sp. 1P06AnD]|uniref:hypothetical protein n=1 Tax=Bacillus sp. 1P06AnD TaxID=3132208 RepID=UPI0039A03662
MKKSTAKNSFILIMPAIVMIVLTLLSDYMITHGNSSWEGFYNFSLLVIFPLAFAVQGILTCITKTGFLMGTGLSLIVYAILSLIFLGPGALLYLAFYVIASIFGYMMFFLMGKLK